MKKLLVSLSLIVIACSPAREQTKERTFVQPVGQFSEKLGKAYQTPLKNENLSAASRVEVLSQQSSEKRFQFLQAFENRNEKLVGRVEVAANPFIQFALSSEKLKRDDLKTFIKQVEDARDKGEIGGVQWAAFVAAREVYQTTGSTWAINKFQTQAINQKIAATFPGVLGGVNELDKSLPYLLLRKFDGGIDPSNSVIQKTLSASVPLLGRDLDTDMRESLGSAIRHYPLGQNLNDSERAASFILFQRMFSQLLLLKGHSAVKFDVQDNQSSIKSLTDNKASFDTQTRNGYFVDAKTGKGLALSSNDIAAYDPAKRLLLFSALPGGSVASFETVLRVMTATSLAFEASSPAAFFVDGPSQYIFGDVTSIVNRAVVPGEAHSLSFGLTVMNLKNINARHIAMVNAKGQDVTVAGGAPAGMALFDIENGQKVVRLDQVLKMIEFNIQLDQALEQIIKKDATNRKELRAMNSFYDEPANQPQVIIPAMMDLRGKLKAMRFPLYLLTMRLISSNCPVIAWNPATGFLPPALDCKIAVDQKRRTGRVIVELGSYIDQKLMIAIGDKLSRAR